jgi:hypothetical protein
VDVQLREQDLEGPQAVCQERMSYCLERQSTVSQRARLARAALSRRIGTKRRACRDPILSNNQPVAVNAELHHLLTRA